MTNGERRKKLDEYRIKIVKFPNPKTSLYQKWEKLSIELKILPDDVL